MGRFCKSFVSSVIWSEGDTPQTVAPLVARLAEKRDLITHAQAGSVLPLLPVIVDVATSERFHLSVGKTFSQVDGSVDETLSLVVVGIILCSSVNMRRCWQQSNTSDRGSLL